MSQTPKGARVESRLVRWKQVRITLQLIQQLITTDADSTTHEWGARCVAGVPPTARLVRCYVDGTILSAPQLVLVFEDEAWSAVPERDIPILEPQFQEYRRSSAPGAQEDTEP